MKGQCKHWHPASNGHKFFCAMNGIRNYRKQSFAVGNYAINNQSNMHNYKSEKNWQQKTDGFFHASQIKNHQKHQQSHFTHQTIMAKLRWKQTKECINTACN